MLLTVGYAHWLWKRQGGKSSPVCFPRVPEVPFFSVVSICRSGRSGSCSLKILSPCSVCLLQNCPLTACLLQGVSHLGGKILPVVMRFPSSFCPYVCGSAACGAVGTEKVSSYFSNGEGCARRVLFLPLGGLDTALTSSCHPCSSRCVLESREEPWSFWKPFGTPERRTRGRCSCSSVPRG